jgi:hypothetical protein
MNWIGVAIGCLKGLAIFTGVMIAGWIIVELLIKLL